MFEEYLMSQISMLCKNLIEDPEDIKEILFCAKSIIHLIPTYKFRKHFPQRLRIDKKSLFQKAPIKNSKYWASQYFKTDICYVLDQYLNGYAEIIFYYSIIIQNIPISFTFVELHKFFPFYPTNLEYKLIFVFENIVEKIGFENILKQYIKNNGIKAMKKLIGMLLGSNIHTSNKKEENVENGCNRKKCI